MRKLLRRIRTILMSVPLRGKILGLAFGLIGTFSLITLNQVGQELNVNIDTVLRDESRFVAKELSYQARDYILVDDFFGLNRILKNMAENRPDIRYAFVVDSGNQVLAHTFGRKFPLELLGIDRGEVVAADSTVKIVTNEGPVWDSQYPVVPGEGDFVRVGVKGDNLRQRLSLLITSLMRNTIIIGILGAFCALLLTWIITRPVRKLLDATRKIRRGEYDIDLQVEARDEIGELVEGFNAMARSLEQGEKIRLEKELLQRDFLQKIIAGQEAERMRIARDLHDQTGQALATCMVDLKMLGRARTEEAREEGIARLKKAITRELDALHDLAMDLRPSVLDDLGLVAAIEMYAHNFEKRHGIVVRLSFLGSFERRPDPCVETCIYRIIQESMANIAKHAKAGRVNVFLEKRGRIIRGGVEDDGIGFDMGRIDFTGHMGIYGMRERAQLLEGSLTIDSDEGIGTMITFEVPVTPEKECHE